jgi:hypothetical protein
MILGERNNREDVFRGQQLEMDFNCGSKTESKEKETTAKPENKFLMKMKQQKQQKEENQGIEQQVINLGFVQSIASKMSANEMAASGI